MPSPTFLTKAFIAGFSFGHLLIPTERSWFFKLARSPAFDVLLPTVSDWKAANTTLTSSPRPTSARSHTNHQPNLSPEISAFVRPNTSDPEAHRSYATQAAVSRTICYAYGLPSASGRPPVLVEIAPSHGTRPGPPVQFGLTFRSLFCISVLLYLAILVIYRKLVPKRKTQELPQKVVSAIIAELQGDPQSMKACSLVSRSWAKESHRYLFHTISLDSRQSVDFWFSPDAFSLANHVRSIRLSMGTVAGAEHGLSRFQCVKTLRILDWYGSQHSLPTGWAPLNKVVDHLELVQPEGTTYEILKFISVFTSLESLLITHSHRQLKFEVHTMCTVDPVVVSTRFRMLGHLPADGVGLARLCSDIGISVELHLDLQDIDEPLTVILGCSNARATRPCAKCFTRRSLEHRPARLIHLRSGRTLSTFRINALSETMIGMVDSLLISLPCISPRSTKVIIEQFRDVDAIAISEILPRFRSLGGVVEIGVQRIRI